MRKDVGRDQRALRPRHPAARAGRHRRAQDEAHPALGQGAARHRHPARRHRPALGSAGERRDAREDRPLLRRGPGRRSSRPRRPSTIYEVPLLFEAQGLGDLVVRELGLGATAKPADLTAWRALVDRIKRPKPELEIALVGKYIELPDAYLSVTEALRHAGLGARSHDPGPLGRLGDASRRRTWPSALAGVAGVLVPGGFGHRGIEGKVLAARLRPRAQGALPGPVPGAAVRRHRVRAGRGRRTGGELDRVRPVHGRPGHRLHARPARHGGQGRHDAAGPLPGPPHARHQGGRGVRQRGHLRAPPPPLRGQQPATASASRRPAWSCRASRRTAGWWRSSSCATTRGSWPASSIPSSESRPDRPHPLFDGFVRAAVAHHGRATADDRRAVAPTPQSVEALA